MANSTLLAAYLSPSVQSTEGEEPCQVDPNDILDQLCTLSGKLEIPLPPFGTVVPEIELLSYPCENETVEWHGEETNALQILGRSEHVMKIAAQVPIPTTDLQILSPNGRVERTIDASRAQQILKEYAPDVFEKRVQDLIVAANISCVGSFEVLAGFLCQDQAYTDWILGMSVGLLRESVQHAATMNWPHLRKLDFSSVWKWLTRHEGFLVGFGGDPTSRALNALTYLFDETWSQPMTLLWALVGIETLYTKGHSGLTAQAREKIEAFLGSPQSYKKNFQRMYDLRSRFVHGDLSFPGQINIGPGVEHSYFDELDESIQLASAILVATLQELVERDWDGITFSYVPTDSSK